MRGQVIRAMLPLFCMVVVIILLGGCDKAEKAEPVAETPEVSTAPLGLIEEGKLIGGTSPDYPPYEFRLQKENTNQIVGLDIAIAEAIASELNLKLVIRDYYFSKLFPALENGEIDLVIAGLSPTEGRKQMMDFSEVYYKAVQNMVVRKTDAEIYSDLDNLRDKRVGTQRGSIQADMVKQLIRGAEFSEKDTITELIEALKNSELDAIMIEAPVAEALAYKDEILAVVPITGTDQVQGMEMVDSAIAVKKGNQKLLDSINMVLQKLITENRIESFASDASALMELP